VRRLLADEHSVTVFDSLLTGRRENIEGLEGELEFIKGDIRDSATLLEVLASRSFECVFHLAALPSVRQSFLEPQESHDINATGTLNVLSAARALGCPRLVFASSCSVYGDAAPIPASEEAPLKPLSPYAAQKLLGENYCRLYSEFMGLSTVVLRFFNVYGPRQDPGSEYAAVVPKFLSRVSEGLAPFVYGDGEQTRDFVYVEDAATACLLAAESPKAPGKVLNIGSAFETRVLALAKMTMSVAGLDIAPEHRPEVPGEVRHSCADITSARSILGYSPTISLEEGLRRTFEFMISAEEA
jgi:UDP-glucose 4-epimerase